jgi:hypothetical protein
MFKYAGWTLASVILLTSTPRTWAGKGPWVPYPSQAEVDAVTAEITAGSIGPALEKIHAWVDGDEVPWALWHDWLPMLMDGGRNQDAADLALEAVVTRPDTEYVAHLMECRTKALINLEKPQEALQAAKGYYNVCSLANTSDAISLVGICLAKAHPEDLEIVRRFKKQQAAASQMQNDGDSATASPPPGNGSMLKSVKIDSAVYEDGLKEWATKTDFDQRVNYANLLLISDRCADAEQIFRELYQTADSDQNLQVAMDGIARTLRAEDGDVARTNAWLISLQQQAANSKK